MIRHPLSLLPPLLLLGCAAVLTGCAPSPAPEPTPLFASEEEAFAAAEETYRAYIDALNAVDTSDPTTFEPLFALATGEFEASDREVFSRMHAENLTISGASDLVRFEGIDMTPTYASIRALACVDVSETSVTNAQGGSEVDPGRPDVYGLIVTFVSDESTVLIESSAAKESERCAE